MIHNINPKKIREELIKIYEKYLTKEKKEEAISLAKEFDGLWSGSFLLEKELEEAIRGLRYFYLEPELEEEKAKKILEAIKK